MSSSSVPFLSLVVCILSLVCVATFSACDGSGGVGGLGREDEPELAEHSFDSLVKLKFATLGPDGPVEFTSGEQLKRILALYSPEKVSAQSDFDNEQVGQQINPEGPDRFILQTAATASDVPHVVYNNLSANMGGMFYSNNADFVNHSTNVGQAIWSFGQIDDEQTSAGKIGVVVGGFGADDNTRILSSAEGIVQVVVDFKAVNDPAHGQRVFDISAKVDGTEVFSVTGLRRPLEETNGQLPIIPIFESSVSGTYAIEVDDDGDSGENFGNTYFVQRGLALSDALPDYSLNPGASATFANSFQWDFGDSPTDLQQASWDIKITDPAGAEVTTLHGTGRTIATSWDTTSLELAGPIRLKPKDLANPDGGTPIYGYEIIIRALAYDNDASNLSAVNDSGPTTFDDVFYEVSSATTSHELKIVNAKLTPDPPFQNDGDHVELKADIVAVGFDDITEQDVDWWVELLGPDGQPLGDPLATGKGFQVQATWDGTVNGAAVGDPNSFALRISATTCNSEINSKRTDVRAQGPGCSLVRANYQLEGPRMILKAVTADSTGASSAQVVGLGLPPSVLSTTGQLKAVVDDRREKLGHVHRIVPSSNGGYDVTIETQVEFVEGVEPPDILILRVRNMLTGEVGPPIEAARQRSTDQGAIYLAQEVNLPREFVNADTMDLSQAATRYSIGEFYRSNGKLAVAPSGGLTIIPGRKGDPGVSDGVTEAFVHLVNNSVDFPEPRSFLGRFAENAIVARDRSDLYPEGATAPSHAPDNIPPSNPTDIDAKALELIQTVTSDPANLLATGFVPIEFSVKATDADTDNRNPLELTPVYVKVPRVPDQPSKASPDGPNVVLWTFHGDNHETGEIHPSDDYDRSISVGRKNWDLNPQTPEVRDSLEFVQTLILTGCGILDVNDYNNGRLNLPVTASGALAGWPGVLQRKFGGEYWDEAMATTAKSGAVILGYNDVSPLLRVESGKAVNSMAEILALYESELVRLSSVPAADRRQWAWMSANVKYADRSTSIADDRWVALHASAIDARYYYYVPQLKDRFTRPPIVGPGGYFITFETRLSTIKASTPVYRIPRSSPPGEWGVTAPGTVDLMDWQTNRNRFAQAVSIPGLTYSRGGDL
jgi:hypothetical protein